MKKYVMIHCTATPEGREVTAAQIDAWHKTRKFEPYTDPKTGRKTYAGYHLLVHLDGSYERLRPDTARGQHCAKANMNNDAISICYVGGCADDGKLTPKDTRTEAQKRTLLTLVRTLKGRYPGIEVVGHRDYDARACPSFDAKSEYSNT
ncbi:MAG: N-acetylmuramoyl-L-alanine amidase [Muribaculaceae bacterium]|nr:N-acetylmuramoyl-L-alanine amidase [Muribaculaceae bacterium]